MKNALKFPILLLLILAGFSLRPGISSIAPLADVLQRQFYTVSSAGIGLLTSIPVVCMGIISPLAFLLEKRIGLRQTLMTGLILVFFGELLRWFDSWFGLLLLTAVLVGVGDALIRPMISGFIKLRCADRGRLAMSLYAASMGAGAGSATLSTASLAEFTGHPGGGLAFWALPTLLALVCWSLFSLPAHYEQPQVSGNKKPLFWLAAGLSLFFALQAGINYTLIAWLPAWLRSEGYGAAKADSLTTLLIVVSTLVSLFYSAIVRLFAGREYFTMLAAVMASLLAAALYTVGAPVIIPLLLMGFTLGLCFPLALHLPVAISPDAASAVRLSGWVQTVGYLAGGLLPSLAGMAMSDRSPAAALATIVFGLTVLLTLTALAFGFSRIRHQ
ncbi:CynX/NimT family MFS transporter [Erwinia sp. JUb26]|uniref:MFS transporter n=1 Tax=Erwinia sp. JUb26 TaxID=2485126 RepID=UPI000F499316|nr:MFS transporter [Erwinia sp. JUb26]ROR10047.1 CP family cyanate transporter-like MFS transporter [Erwinia sp. JUb26]